MAPQQPPIYQNMINNQQANLYNLGGGNSSLNLTSNQPPMAAPNQQWQNRPPQDPYNQVKSMSIFSFIFYSLPNSDDAS